MSSPARSGSTATGAASIRFRPAGEADWREAPLRPGDNDGWVGSFPLEANARYTPRGSDPATDPDGGWVHPKELHGLLLGISRTGLAWDWSGREELVPSA